ncbi:hypothetical protein BAY59_10600 [Prauserella coralliicola]|nr:hypothetical protein BAY59_10600 [Prauserella coralliicola]
MIPARALTVRGTGATITCAGEKPRIEQMTTGSITGLSFAGGSEGVPTSSQVTGVLPVPIRVKLVPGTVVADRLYMRP